ncbi:hypothetical protein B0I35DRAFT_425094 [Stachybotrys elegans]|uniref:FAD-binding domain-containing protein n=1 Tax=Stachybotrys elegans TaxID=80388 RepID=A0A8K0WU29_9HYPO|nr:hypothetical protein B0I35DRAFT_425094 [Stachybotrys elegans]
MSFKIAIVGGGPAGLTLARLLHQKGINYIVYERAESKDSQLSGGSLDIHEETGQAVLKEAGLFDEFRKYARWEDDRSVLYDKDGKSYGEFGGQAAESAARPEIDRLDLRKILLESFPAEKLRWGSAVSGLRPDGNGKWSLDFSDGSSASDFDLVVGADGAFSKTRRMITTAKPQYAGSHYIESKISTEHPIYSSMSSRFGRGTSMALGGSREIILQTQGDGTYRIYFGMLVPEDFTSRMIDLSNINATQQTLLSSEYFGDWAEEYKSYIRHCDNFRSWPLHTFHEEDLSWKHVPGLTLMGDAAHLSVPDGEGVNCAMVDALKLAEKITLHGTSDLNQAIAQYEEEMLDRGKKHIAHSKVISKLMFHPDGPSALLQAFEHMQGEV